MSAVREAAPRSSPPQHLIRARPTPTPRPPWRLACALFICVAVPSAMLVGLWPSLTRRFWFNEVWRAYEISKGSGWWAALKTGGPMPAGWYFLERASSYLFGSTELTLRLPTALFVPVMAVVLMLLARWWMPLWAAVVVGLLASLTGTLLVYAVQLSEYQVDAAAAVAVILCHTWAWDDSRPAGSHRRVYCAYGGVALACIFSTPALFVAAPVLGLDVIRAARRRSLRPRGLAAVACGLVVLIHLRFFVVPQNSLRKSTYWDPAFLPRHGFAKQLEFVRDGLKGFLTQAFTGTLNPRQSILLRPDRAGPLTVCLCALFVLGLVRLARSEAGRTILVAVVGSQLLTLLASYFRYWPFGFVRTNFYLVPLLILVAAIGAAGALSPCARTVLGRRTQRTATGRWGAALAMGALIALVTVVGTGFAATYELTSYLQIRASAHSMAYGANIPSAVSVVRVEATPTTDLIVAGYMATAGWQYYAEEYHGGSAGVEPPRDRVLFVSGHGSSAITQLVRGDHPSGVFVYVPTGTTGSEVGLDLAAVDRGASCHVTHQQSFAGSGLLVDLACPKSVRG